jgi:hypothetical protein
VISATSFGSTQWIFASERVEAAPQISEDLHRHPSANAVGVSLFLFYSNDLVVPNPERSGECKENSTRAKPPLQAPLKRLGLKRRDITAIEVSDSPSHADN